MKKVSLFFTMSLDVGYTLYKFFLLETYTVYSMTLQDVSYSRGFLHLSYKEENLNFLCFTNSNLKVKINFIRLGFKS